MSFEMGEIFQKVWDVIQRPENRETLTWVGGGIVAGATGIWAVVKFLAERKKADDKKSGDTNVSVGQGFGIVRDQTFQAPVSFAPSLELVAQIQKPLADELAAQRAQIENLTKMLLERNPVAAAGPGAQQAISEAVTAITEGAAEGDSRLQQALALLKVNKIAEAEPLLTAFADDKTARIEKDRKEAAIAYRNLGAIAGLRDPKAAREAYAKAVALDPDNADGLAWDGWLQLSAKNLAAAEKSYRALLRLADKGADEHQIFWARTGLGNIAVVRGDLNAALAAYGEARASMERLAGSDAGNTDWQRELSVSNNKIGDVLVLQGNLPEAEKSYRAGLAIAERLAGSDAGNAGWQQDLSVSIEKLGDIYLAQGNLPSALEQYRASLDRMVPIRDRDLSNADLQRFTSVTLEKIGDVLVAQGKLAEAEKSYRAGLAIRERLAGSDSRNAEWQRDLSVSNERLGDIFLAQENFHAALEQYRASLDRMVPIRDRDPSNADLQRFTSVTLSKLANAYRASGDKAKARGYLRQGHEIIARLTKLSPDNAVWKSDLAWFDGQIKELGP
jgi:tetratricopeptide (TPR) repeat protein